jgi:hypothetical protein
MWSEMKYMHGAKLNNQSDLDGKRLHVQWIGEMWWTGVNVCVCGGGDLKQSYVEYLYHKF